MDIKLYLYIAYLQRSSSHRTHCFDGAMEHNLFYPLIFLIHNLIRMTNITFDSI